MKFEWNLVAIIDHEVHAGQTAHIRNLMRIADGSNGSVQYGQSRKFRREEQRTFDVHMRIDEAGQQKGIGGASSRIDLRDAGNASIYELNLGGINPLGQNVDQLANYDQALFLHRSKVRIRF